MAANGRIICPKTWQKFLKQTDLMMEYPVASEELGFESSKFKSIEIQ